LVIIIAQENEADWLVNIEEEGISKDRERLEKVVGEVFRTVTGRQLAEKFYPPS
jgi:hypothetical protein